MFKKKKKVEIPSEDIEDLQTEENVEAKPEEGTQVVTSDFVIMNELLAIRKVLEAMLNKLNEE